MHGLGLAPAPGIGSVHGLGSRARFRFRARGRGQVRARFRLRARARGRARACNLLAMAIRTSSHIDINGLYTDIFIINFALISEWYCGAVLQIVETQTVTPNISSSSLSCRVDIMGYLDVIDNESF